MDGLESGLGVCVTVVERQVLSVDLQTGHTLQGGVEPRGQPVAVQQQVGSTSGSAEELHWVLWGSSTTVVERFARSSMLTRLCDSEA